MKRSLALIIAAIIAASALAACAAPRSALDPRIALTSSDAADAASWLADRLGDRLGDRVVVGTDPAGYDVDVSSLEDDGYVIRACGGEDVLLAKTPDGLDRAARKYVKMVEAGDVSDVTYHEGYRVKRIELAGRDIAEYTVYAEDSAPVIAAARDFAAQIERACGASIAVVVGEPSAPYISLGYTHDESLGNVGYTWEISEDGLTLRFSDLYPSTAPAVGVRRYLERALDWFGLSYGYEDLAPADLVSLNAGDAGADVCDFDYISSYGDFADPDNFTNGHPAYSNIVHACHGVLAHKLAADLSKNPDRPWMYDEPCWLDETFYEYALEDLTDYIEANIAAGNMPGEGLRFIDIAQSDNAGWCTCKKCTEMYRAEGLTHAGEVLTFANAISEELNETYPGIYYGVFAYWDTKKPPKTIRPNDLLYVTYCFDCNCSLHALDGSKCTTGEPYNNWKTKPEHDNATVCYYYEQWEKMTDKLYAWYYAIGNGFLTASYVHRVRDDLSWLYEHGARGLFWEAEDEGYNVTKVGRWLSYLLTWDIDMSDERFDEYYDRILRLLYGEDNVGVMRAIIDEQTRIYANTPCATCWGWGPVHASVSPVMWEQSYDYLFELSERALSRAESRMMELRLTRISCALIYRCSLSSYYDAVNAGDEARVAELCRRYALIDERLTAFGCDMTAIRPFAGEDATMYYRDLETQMTSNAVVRNAPLIGIEVTER